MSRFLRDTAQPSRPAKKKNPVITVLSSLRLTIALLLILAFSSILGTIVPQKEAAGNMYAHLSPGMLKVFTALGLFDVYHSFWFLLITGVLCLNIIVCTTRRLPPALRQLRRFSVHTPPSHEHWVDISIDKDETDKIMLQLERILRFRFTKIEKTPTDRGVLLFAQRGRYKKVLLFAAHLSILVIICGMILGRYAGFEAYVLIAEGDSTQTAYLNNSPDIIDLGFTLRCDSFKIDYYEGGMPKEFLSELSFIEDGKVEAQGFLRVNHPLSFKGIRFYQANYDIDYVAKMNVSASELMQPITVAVHREYLLEDGKTRVTALRIEPDLMKMGPAVELDISDSDNHERIWVFKHINTIESNIPDLFTKAPKFNPGRFKPYVFSLEGLVPHYKTGLMVNRDPGSVIVAIGSLFFLIGIFISLLSAPKRIWVRTEGGTISITAQAGRLKPYEDKEIQQILQQIPR